MANVNFTRKRIIKNLLPLIQCWPHKHTCTIIVRFTQLISYISFICLCNALLYAKENILFSHSWQVFILSNKLAINSAIKTKNLRPKNDFWQITFTYFMLYLYEHGRCTAESSGHNAWFGNMHINKNWTKITFCAARHNRFCSLLCSL